eukprot:6212666-Pleurochrysis_carterae.AAC.2
MTSFGNASTEALLRSGPAMDDFDHESCSLFETNQMVVSYSSLQSRGKNATSISHQPAHVRSRLQSSWKFNSSFNMQCDSRREP